MPVQEAAATEAAQLKVNLEAANDLLAKAVASGEAQVEGQICFNNLPA
jgi:hypothetical protein